MTNLLKIHERSHLGINLDILDIIQRSLKPIKSVSRSANKDFYNNALLFRDAQVKHVSLHQTRVLADEFVEYIIKKYQRNIDIDSLPQHYKDYEIQMKKLKNQRIKIISDFFNIQNSEETFGQIYDSFNEFKHLGSFGFIKNLTDKHSHKLERVYSIPKNKLNKYKFKTDEVVYFNGNLYSVISTHKDIVSITSPRQTSPNYISTIDLNRCNPERLIVKNLVK